jgi:hypothetical protein
MKKVCAKMVFMAVSKSEAKRNLLTPFSKIFGRIQP